jgi:hypothetical protein
MGNSRGSSGKDTACPLDGHALLVEKGADLPQYLHIPFGIEPLALGRADRLEAREFPLPEAQHTGRKVQLSGGFTNAVHSPGLGLFPVHILVLGLRAEEMAL